jgi:hypothetical protein
VHAKTTTYVAGNVKDGVRDTSIFRLARVKIVRSAVGSNLDIFQQGVRVDGPVNVRFRLFRQVDRLGVAPALKVKNAVVVPPVFVVTDQGSFGVGAQRGLAVRNNRRELL